ncbi:unnamed protein product, partial [Phaeothamnion confervicola]
MPPCDIILATDLVPPFSVSLTEEPVMYIGPDSLCLVAHAPRPAYPASTAAAVAARTGLAAIAAGTSRKSAITVLDLCAGSGVQGIAAAALYAAEVVCVDVNPRAVRFARFNAHLNGVADQVTCLFGDLYGALEAGDNGGGVDASETAETLTGSKSGGSGSGSSAGSKDNNDGGSSGSSYGGGESGLQRRHQSGHRRRFDVILANPPFIPVPPATNERLRRYDVFADGGPGGEDILRRIVEGAAAHLSPGGVAAIVSELADPEDYVSKIAAW